MIHYFDTSAVVKMYHHENGSAAVALLFENDETENYLSQIVTTEFNCALYRKFSRNEIKDEEEILQSINKFSVDIQYENVININEYIFTEAKNLIIKWGSRFALKTLDAIHLACFVQLSQFDQIAFISADKKLCEIVTAMGYDAINPEIVGI